MSEIISARLFPPPAPPAAPEPLPVLIRYSSACSQVSQKGTQRSQTTLCFGRLARGLYARTSSLTESHTGLPHSGGMRAFTLIVEGWVLLRASSKSARFTDLTRTEAPVDEEDEAEPIAAGPSPLA